MNSGTLISRILLWIFQRASLSRVTAVLKKKKKKKSQGKKFCLAPHHPCTTAAWVLAQPLFPAAGKQQHFYGDLILP